MRHNSYVFCFNILSLICGLAHTLSIGLAGTHLDYILYSPNYTIRKSITSNCQKKKTERKSITSIPLFVTSN